MTAARISVDRGLLLLALSDAIDSVEALVAGSFGADRAVAAERLARYHAEWQRIVGRPYHELFDGVEAVPLADLPLNDHFIYGRRTAP